MDNENSVFTSSEKNSFQPIIKSIAKRHYERTGNKNQIGSVEKILEDLMPDILSEQTSHGEEKNTVDVKVWDKISCQKCSGTGIGQLEDSVTCSWCNGLGYYFRESPKH
jgi:DnaJ-class molecular chaperone